jgi:hypothetical protein
MAAILAEFFTIFECFIIEQKTWCGLVKKKNRTETAWSLI